MHPAERVIKFISRLTHTGDFSGQPFVLRPWQAEPLVKLFGTLRPDGTRQYRKCFMALPRKQGKALALDTLVPTPTGWTTMGDVQVGDILFDDLGHPCTVTYATEEMYDHPCYEVAFSDGTSIVADAEHQWKTFTRNPWNKWGIHTTKEIADTVINGNRGYDRNHSLPPAAILDTKEAELPIDPYVLGAWLGDGNSYQPRITSSIEDREEMMALLGAGAGPMRWERDKGKENTCTIVMSAGRGYGPNTWHAETMLARLRTLGVLKDKHIPWSYLRASSRQRLALFQGLMDTDGYVATHGQCEMVLVNHQLFNDFVELARSLGFKVTTAEDRATLNGKDFGPRYRAKFYSYADRLPAFRLSRKLKRLKFSTTIASRGTTRKIVSVEPVESVPVRCIQVDSPSHLYLAGSGMVATHNTEEIAASGLYLSIGQGKRNQKTYCASGDFKQASLIFAAMAEMLRADPVLERLAIIYDGAKKILFPKHGSSLEVLSSVPKSKHGLSPNNVLVDELHVCSEELVNVLTSAFGARREPLIWYITTAGEDQSSLCYEEWEYARQVRDGIIQDDTYLPVIYEAEPTDDWTSEETWHKAMPALGDFCSLEFIRDEYKKAVLRPRYQSTFKTYYLNLWVSSASAWLAIESWDACGTLTQEDVDALEGKPCYGGLDLGVTGDMSSAVFLFENDFGGLDLIPQFWCPREGSWREDQHHKQSYLQWEYEGWLKFTDGAATDHNVIEQDIVDWNDRFPITLMVADRAYATMLLSRLFNNYGMNVKGIPQGPVTLNEPMTRLENMMIEGKIRHGRHPVLRWNVSNGKIKKSSTGLMFLDKSATSKRIDGLSATVCGAAGWLKKAEEVEEKSVYETRGVLVLGR